MKANSNLVIDGDVVTLVPYRAEHVELYHRWMADPFLQQTTESEPLRALPDTPGTGQHGGAMAGDVNLYFNDIDDRSTAEIEVMVAEPGSRRKGIARQALELFMAYAHTKLNVKCFRAKILESNEPSIALFESLGYAETKRVAVFKEVHMELPVQGRVSERLVACGSNLTFRPYDSPEA